MSNARRYVLTGGIATIAAVGALYGASLKMEQEHKQERTKHAEATPAEQIAQLRAAREVLSGRRAELERKLAQVEARQDGAGE